MKKVFLGLGIVLGTLAFAQKTSGPRVGIKAGMNVSSISQDGGLSDTKSKIGFNAGLYLNAPISGSFSIQPEVIYNDLGSKVTFESGSYKSSYSTKLGYISVPVMFQYNATPEFYLEAGPEFSFLVNADSKLKDNYGNSSSVDMGTDNFNTFNFGVGLGLGYRITNNIGINARYTAGVTKIGKDDNIIGRQFEDSRNNVFQVGLGYTF
ncbi:porin family protein [Elizabethkingia sp. JS20170427COW]|uniref:porin family protein n=1 Tax=Elizabethkingia sp. JS20170427COW TaxID=2583851 RepID=UPI0011105D20|nr:porin family protein [Elizabethkingia sp. JS20170427COW]QCX52333.1 PorT family protein [Elizabethkingia sp. JS20170427COW]